MSEFAQSLAYENQEFLLPIGKDQSSFWEKSDEFVPSHPILKALKNITYGHLAMVTPEGKELTFRGHIAGLTATMILKDWDVLDEGIARGEIGFAETYIEGRWDSDNLAEFITLILMNNDVLEKFLHGRMLYVLYLKVKSLIASNSRAGSRRNIATHYDLGNNFYKLWLDKSMTYSCALFEGDESRTLEEAQQAKYQRILKKLNAVPGDHILEIGCGWGGFAEAAARSGLHVTAITLSKEQADFARERLRVLGLGDLVEIQLIDYREVTGEFDYIVSIGMFEHVGQKYWPVYFSTIRNLLKQGGRAMVQSITLDDTIFEKTRGKTGFIEHYIFPGGELPSKKRFRTAAEKAGLQCQEMYAFGMDYKRTLTEWLQRFNAHIKEVKDLGYGENFIRLWHFYLASCIATFASRRSDVMQAELTVI